MPSARQEQCSRQQHPVGKGADPLHRRQDACKRGELFLFQASVLDQIHGGRGGSDPVGSVGQKSESRVQTDPLRQRDHTGLIQCRDQREQAQQEQKRRKESRQKTELGKEKRDDRSQRKCPSNEHARLEQIMDRTGTQRESAQDQRQGMCRESDQRNGTPWQKIVAEPVPPQTDGIDRRDPVGEYRDNKENLISAHCDETY